MSDFGDLTFIGNATVLLRIGSFTFLTDPNFLHAGEHAYLGKGLRSKRLREPALQIADLPTLDFILLSHHHGDHFDHRAAAELDKDLPIVTEPGSARKLQKQGFHGAIALKTWESHEWKRDDETLRITSMPGKHAPGLLQSFLPSVMGSLVEYSRTGEQPFRVYVTGDTLFHEDLREIPIRYPEIDLCLIHLGGTRIAGVMLTMDAEQGVRTLRLVAPRKAIPIHYDDYTVFTSPISDFRQQAEELSDVELHYLERGEVLQLKR